MSSENKAIIQRWFNEIWNEGNEATIDELLAPEAVIHGLEHPESVGKTGPEAFKPFFHTFRGAFPDIHIHIDEMVAEGDTVATHFTVTGTHGGDRLGFAASNKTINLTGSSFARIKNGQLIEGRNTIDMLTLFQQIDAVKMA